MASTLNISILDSSPSRAADIINTLIDIYTEQAIIDKNRVNDRSSDFINSRIEIIERELGLVEDEIENYKRKNLRLTDDNSNSKYISKNNNYEDEILRYDTQLKIIEFLKDEISDAASSREVIPNLNSVGIQELNLLVDKYNALKIKRDRLIEDSSKNSPIVLETDKAMDGIIESITVALDNAASILNTRRDDALSHHINTQSILAATPSFERQLQNINRQHKIKESLYLFLLNKREDNEISKALVESNIQVLDAAEVPRSPISPNLPKMIAAALMCGVLLPTLCFVMGIFLDTKVHNIKDMDGLISVPYLGNTPKVKHGISSKSTPAIHDVGSAEDFVLAESCRILRTNIDFHSRLHGDAKVIMITSIDDGAGKTFLAQNLAASMGCGGATVLVDLDIRSLSLTNSMCANAQGITDYLINNSLEPHSIVQHLPQFDIVPAGKQIPNISEWLASERLDSLFAYLRSAYRHVIVDCASVGFVADTSIVNRLADITICVIRSGRFDRSELPTLERLFQSGRLKNMAIVINGTKIPSKYRDLHESFYI